MWGTRFKKTLITGWNKSRNYDDSYRLYITIVNELLMIVIKHVKISKQ